MTTPTTTTKRCGLCERVLDVSQFSPLKTARSGRHSHCKECRRTYANRHRRKVEPPASANSGRAEP